MAGSKALTKNPGKASADKENLEGKGMDHITVCICTFKRPQQLKRLLYELSQQEVSEFTFSIVVADNDACRSAEPVVSDFAQLSSIPVTYCLEPEQNIALARNRALEHANGNFIACIDDDEYPTPSWLSSLYNTCRSYGADGVLGPVFPQYETPPPNWVLEGGFFDRPTHETGVRIGYSDMRTSNAIFRKDILKSLDSPFRAEFGSGGEDADFFRRLTRKGYLFVWCNEAVVKELIPPSRLCCRYVLRRALHRGNITFKFKEGRAKAILKAFVAVPVYSISLPFLVLRGKAWFMIYLMKLCDHAGLLLAFFGITPFQTYK